LRKIVHGLGGERAPRLGLELARGGRYCSIFWRAPSIVYFSVYSRCFTSNDQLDLAPLIDAVAGAVLGGLRKRNWLSQ